MEDKLGLFLRPKVKLLIAVKKPLDLIHWQGSRFI